MGVFDPKILSTQDHLDIEDIRDDIVILKNGKACVVIETSSLNFDLLDEKEQDSRIYAFAAFLNSILFPIQIVIRTQRTDIARYLKLLEEYKQQVTSEKVYEQVSIYQDFISRLTATTQILDKRFFIVVPSQKLPIVETSWIKLLFGKPKRILNISEILAKAKEELWPKRDQVIRNLGNMGISAKQLTSDELVKLFYTVYEPDKSGIDILTIRKDDIQTGLITHATIQKDQNDI
ncbi:MAG: hypothetical protein NZZ41_03480 [Candidatus Dojkabacteria bacterium]|nr:hypothetical protein [Candidatus Dojkabacteria bacterium]